jgi:hypothetical protein
MEVSKQPVKSTGVWEYNPDQRKRSVWFYLLIVVILISFGVILGSFSSLSFKITDQINSRSPSLGVNYFWVGIAIQQVGSIWFGFWGVLAGIIFPLFSNAVTNASILISIAYLPANFLQSFLPAFVFRRLKLNPDLETSRDYLYLLLSMFVSSLFGALWSVFMLVIVLGQIERDLALTSFFGWFGGNIAAGITFNFLLLKAFSKIVVEKNLLVKKWF